MAEQDIAYANLAEISKSDGDGEFPVSVHIPLHDKGAPKLMATLSPHSVPNPRRFSSTIWAKCNE